MASETTGSTPKTSLPWLVAGTAAALVAIALAMHSGSPARPNAKPSVSFSAAEQTAVLTYARARLEGKTPGPLSDRLRAICGKHVFVHLFRNAKSNYLYGVSDAQLKTNLCLQEALDSTVARIQNTRSWGKVFGKDLAATRVGVSVESSPIKPARITLVPDSKQLKGAMRKRIGWRLHSQDFSIGHDGLYLRADGDAGPVRHWAPPIEGVARTHGREDNQTHLRAYTAHHLAKVGIKKSRDKADKPEVSAYHYQTVLMVESAPGVADAPLSPVRGNTPIGRSDADEIYETATHLTDYLVRILSPSGRFDYEYYADKDSSSRDYNIVRHAGTTYSLLFSHAYTGSPEYLKAGLLAKEYMVANLAYKPYQPLAYHSAEGAVAVPFPEPDGSIKLLALEMDGKASLGATALALLAFAKIPKASVEAADAERIRHMVNFTWYLQCESGGFYATYDHAKKGKCPDPQPLYYPGETLLALNTLYQVDPNPGLLAIAEKSIGFELQRFNEGMWPDHWVMQALDLMQANMPEKAKAGKWSEAAHAMAKKYIARQYMPDRSYAPEPPFPEFEGGHVASKGPPRNTPTGSRSEAIAGVWRLLQRNGRHEEAAVLGDHLVAAAHFIRSELYRPDNTYYLPDPEQSLWGLRGSMIDQTVRIDFNQHALVGVWGAWEVALGRKGIGWPIPVGEEAEALEKRAATGQLITHKGRPPATH